ncbi:MAG: shikimate kinase, partial [Flavobacteriaceae bacterium]|nr:shikimate kinase [Flavobacteriaceae bacterium]
MQKRFYVMIISLVGYMGSGKTTVGKRLSENLNLNFVDLDDYIVSNEKRSIKDIFSEKGEIYFRKIENSCLDTVLNTDNIVLSPGGGTPVYYNNMELINSKSISFYLKMSPAELTERL